MAKEKIKIFELNIDVDAAIQAQSKLKDKLDSSRDSLKKMKKQGDTNSQQYVELEAKVKSLSSEYNSSQTQLGKLINLQGKNIKTIQQGRNALSVVSKEWAKQADLYGENSQAAEKLAKKKTELTSRLKELEGATGDHSRNVGNYTESILEATGAQQAYVQGQQAWASAQGLTNIVVGKSTGLMKAFRIALASTGIGLIVLALGSLVTYLTSTQEGINKVNRVLTPMKELFGALIGQAQELGKAFFKLLSGDFKGFITDVKAIGNTIKTDLGEALDRGKEIQSVRENLNRTEADYIKKQAELKKVFEEQKKLAEDQTKSQEVREKAAKAAIQSQEDLRALTVDRLEQEARLIELKQQSNDTTDQEKADLARKMAEIDNALAEEAAKTTEAQNKLNTIRKEGYQKARELRQKAIGEVIAQKEQELALFKEQNRLEADTLEERLTLQRQTAEKEKDILKAKLEAKKISELQYRTEILQIDNEIKEAEEANEAAELERIKTFEDKKRSLQEEIRLANAESELARAEMKAEMDFEKHVAELEQLQLREEEKIELLALLETQKEQVVTDIRSQFEKQRLDNFKQVMQEDIAIRKQNASEAAGVASQLTGILTGLLGDSLAAKLASIAVDAAVQAGLVSITTASSQAQNLAQATATAPPPFNVPFIAAALGQNAIMQAQSSTAITKILASAAVQGLGTVAKSAKFESGGLMEIGGKRHSQGGTKFIGEDGTSFEAEEGELIGVVNRRAASMINSLNKAYPMAGAMRSNNYLAAGGVVQRAMQGAGSAMSMQQAIDYDLLAQKIGQANMMLPRPVVSVEEINTGQGNYAQVVNGANV